MKKFPAAGIIALALGSVSVIGGCAPSAGAAPNAEPVPAANVATTTPTAATDPGTAPAADPAAAPAAAPALAQAGYQVQEDIGSGAAASTPGPVRMARVSYQTGSVAWRPSDSVDWSTAAVNVPARAGASYWAKPGARTEVQFDDGSSMRISGGTTVEIVSMYSDSQGEFTEVKQTGGLASYSLRHSVSEFQIDTPQCSVKAFGPASIRIGVGDSGEIAVHSGQAQIVTDLGTSTATAGDLIEVGTQAAPVVSAAPAPDSWDEFCNQRETACEHTSQYLPANINLVAGDIDSYGTWSNDPQYGAEWSPNVASTWRPYSEGRWVWVSPVGWTWVDNEPWGWAPSHYGTWANRRNRWFWRPGPVTQYWSPAVVSFSDYNGTVAWCPLAPEEVVYPSTLAVGFGGGDWSVLFSIGSAGCYYPGSNGYCSGRPWENGYLNGGSGNQYNITQVNNYYGNAWQSERGYYGRNTFVPRNAGFNGASFAAGAAFGTATSFHGRSGAATFFKRGNGFTGMPRAGAQVFGPGNVRPTLASFTPSHRYEPSLRPPASTTGRQVFRATVPTAVARQGVTVSNTRRPSSTRPIVMRRAAAGAERPGMTATRTTSGRLGTNVATRSNTRVAARSTAATHVAPRGSATASHGRTAMAPPQRATPTRTATRTAVTRPAATRTRTTPATPRTASPTRRTTTVRRTATPTRRTTPERQTTRRTAPVQRASRPQTRAAQPARRPQTRNIQRQARPQQQRAAPQRQSRPQQQRAAPQRQSRPQQQRAAPQRQSRPQQPDQRKR